MFFYQLWDSALKTLRELLNYSVILPELDSSFDIILMQKLGYPKNQNEIKYKREISARFTLKEKSFWKSCNLSTKTLSSPRTWIRVQKYNNTNPKNFQPLEWTPQQNQYWRKKIRSFTTKQQNFSKKIIKISELYWRLLVKTPNKSQPMHPNNISSIDEWGEEKRINWPLFLSSPPSLLVAMERRLAFVWYI